MRGLVDGEVAGVVAVVYALSLMVLHEATGIVTLGIGFFLIRLLGQGSLGMLSGHTIAMWFERKLGFAHSGKTFEVVLAGEVL